jgi:hypothetical protein
VQTDRGPASSLGRFHLAKLWHTGNAGLTLDKIRDSQIGFGASQTQPSRVGQPNVPIATKILPLCGEPAVFLVERSSADNS